MTKTDTKADADPSAEKPRPRVGRGMMLGHGPFGRGPVAVSGARVSRAPAAERPAEETR